MPFVYILEFVYIIQSTENPKQYYTGLTNNLERHLTDHNNRGKVSLTLHLKMRNWQQPSKSI